MSDEAMEVVRDTVPESKTKRSSGRFNRRLASARRGVVRQMHQNGTTEVEVREREVSRIPTRQEKRVTEAFEQDLSEIEVA